jgi:hypothetical protein
MRHLRCLSYEVVASEWSRQELLQKGFRVSVAYLRADILNSSSPTRGPSRTPRRAMSFLNGRAIYRGSCSSWKQTSTRKLCQPSPFRTKWWSADVTMRPLPRAGLKLRNSSFKARGGQMWSIDRRMPHSSPARNAATIERRVHHEYECDL